MNDLARTRSVIVGLLAAVLLAACSSSGAKPAAPATARTPASSSSAPSGSPTASSSPSAAPAVWTVPQARRLYLFVVAPSNRELKTLNSFNGTTRLPVMRRTCARMAADDDALARRMGAGLWPGNVRRPAAALVTALARERTAFQECAQARSLDDAWSALQHLRSASSAAEEVRIALGLPGTK